MMTKRSDHLTIMTDGFLEGDIVINAEKVEKFAKKYPDVKQVYHWISKKKARLMTKVVLESGHCAQVMLNLSDYPNITVACLYALLEARRLREIDRNFNIMKSTFDEYFR